MKWIQWQRGSDGSTNFQAQIANFGLGYDDVVSIVEKHVQNALVSYSTQAYQTMKDRVEEFTVNFLNVLHERHPLAIENARDPGVQSAILEAQAGYARTGDQDLGEVLVDLLVERTGSTRRDIRQLSIGEAIGVAQKLTGDHFMALSLIFFMTRVRLENVGHHTELYERLRVYCVPFLREFRLTDSDLRYMEATGCLSIGMGENSIPDLWRAVYPGLYTEGMESTNSWVKSYKDSEIIIPSRRNPQRFQANVVSPEDIESLAHRSGRSNIAEGLRRTLRLNPVPEGEIIKEAIEAEPYFSRLFELWNSTPLKHSTLNSVGMAIAHSNARRLLGEQFNAKIDIWIN